MTDFVYLLNLSAEENGRLKAENKKLREVLEWYGERSRKAYEEQPKFAFGLLTEIMLDGGKRAREVLGDD